jgi:hypothetical protein
MGGFMIGYAQGVQTIVDNVNNIIARTALTLPNVGRTLTDLVAAYLQHQVNPTYGSYWEFGALFAIGGFILVARGDRKPRTTQEAEPLPSQPLA